MLTIGEMEISRMEIMAPDFYSYQNGEVFKQVWLKRFELPTDYPVNIGIDQSSTNTGICVEAPDLLYITELPRGYMRVSDYKKALIEQLARILEGKTINHFIFEKHGNHISPLHSLINDITREIKSYSKGLKKDGVKVVGVLPTVWRSGFLPKEEYGGQYTRDKVKEASYAESIKRNANLARYRKVSGKDLDGYEAYGIIEGYLNLNYDEDGNRLVNTTMEFKNGRKYRYRVKKVNLTNVFSEAESISSGGHILLGNKNILIEETLNRVVGEFERATIIFKEHSEFPRLIFELEQVYIPGDCYIITVERSK